MTRFQENFSPRKIKNHKSEENKTERSLSTNLKYTHTLRGKRKMKKKKRGFEKLAIDMIVPK